MEIQTPWRIPLSSREKKKWATTWNLKWESDMPHKDRNASTFCQNEGDISNKTKLRRWLCSRYANPDFSRRSELDAIRLGEHQRRIITIMVRCGTNVDANSRLPFGILCCSTWSDDIVGILQIVVGNLPIFRTRNERIGECRRGTHLYGTDSSWRRMPNIACPWSDDAR